MLASYVANACGIARLILPKSIAVTCLYIRFSIRDTSTIGTEMVLKQVSVGPERLLGKSKLTSTVLSLTNR